MNPWGQAGEDMDQHRLVEQAGVKPKDNPVIFCCLDQLVVPVLQGLHDEFMVQSITSGLFNVTGTILECPRVRLTGYPRVIVQNIVPDENIALEIRLGKEIAGNVTTRDMENALHGFNRKQWQTAPCAR